MNAIKKYYPVGSGLCARWLSLAIHTTSLRIEGLKITVPSTMLFVMAKCPSETYLIQYRHTLNATDSGNLQIFTRRIPRNEHHLFTIPTLIMALVLLAVVREAVAPHRSPLFKMALWRCPRTVRAMPVPLSLYRRD